MAAPLKSHSASRRHKNLMPPLELSISESMWPSEKAKFDARRDKIGIIRIFEPKTWPRMWDLINTTREY